MTEHFLLFIYIYGLLHKHINRIEDVYLLPKVNFL